MTPTTPQSYSRLTGDGNGGGGFPLPSPRVQQQQDMSGRTTPRWKFWPQHTHRGQLPRTGHLATFATDNVPSIRASRAKCWQDSKAWHSLEHPQGCPCLCRRLHLPLEQWRVQRGQRRLGVTFIPLLGCATCRHGTEYQPEPAAGVGSDCKLNQRPVPSLKPSKPPVSKPLHLAAKSGFSLRKKGSSSLCAFKVLSGHFFPSFSQQLSGLEM